MLNPRQIRFCREYAKCLNATQAYAAAYGEDVIGAGQAGHQLLKNLEIKKRIEEAKEELAAREELTQDWVLRQWRQIAEADPNKLTRLECLPCSTCWASDEQRAMYELIGFNLKKDPCPECQECEGNGRERVILADTSKLKGNERRLFAGVEFTKFGPKIKTRNQDQALDRISDYLGMPRNKIELTGANGGPIATAAVELTDEQLLAIAAAATPQTPNHPQ